MLDVLMLMLDLFLAKGKILFLSKSRNTIVSILILSKSLKILSRFYEFHKSLKISYVNVHKKQKL